MKLKNFVVMDTVTNSISCVGIDVTAGRFICSYGPTLFRANRNFEKELKLFEVGYFIDNPLSYVPLDEYIEHDWNEFEKPESVSEKLETKNL